MPTAVATKPAKPAPKPTDFFARLDEAARLDVAEALTQYRSLLHEVAKDPAYEKDPGFVAEILATLRIGPADLKADAQAILAAEGIERQRVPEEQLAAWEVECRETNEKVRQMLADLPKLKGRTRELERLRLTNAHVNGELQRLRARHGRIWGDPSKIVERLAPKPVAQEAGGYQPEVSFSATMR